MARDVLAPETQEIRIQVKVVLNYPETLRGELQGKLTFLT